MGYRTPFIVAAALVTALGAAPAPAGVSFGVSVGGPGFAFSLGYSDYPVYSPAWNSASFSLSFGTTLAGYGEWVRVDGLGRVWRPWVAAGWRPYTWGRWVYTPMGWTWVSYEPWGYVPHHYGSWAFTTIGWVWAPGYTYAPANVVWVASGPRVGWYPAGPPGWSHAHRGFWHGYDHGIRAGYSHGYGDGYRDGWRDARYANFVEWNHFTAENVAAVARPGTALGDLSPRSVRIMDRAPGRDRVERMTGRPVGVTPVAERTVRMGDRTVRAVRPEGVTRSVQRYSHEAVRSGLAPSIARTLERGDRVVTARDRSLPSASRSTGRSTSPRRGGGTPITGAPPAGAGSTTGGAASVTRSRTVNAPYTRGGGVAARPRSTARSSAARGAATRSGIRSSGTSSPRTSRRGTAAPRTSPTTARYRAALSSGRAVTTRRTRTTGISRPAAPTGPAVRSPRVTGLRTPRGASSARTATVRRSPGSTRSDPSPRRPRRTRR